jgi:hypothetical protein
VLYSKQSRYGRSWRQNARQHSIQISLSPFTISHVFLSDMGRQEEALDAIQKAVEIRRGLAMQYPLVFKPKLVNSLKQLSHVLSTLGKDEEARVAMKEADTLASP